MTFSLGLFVHVIIFVFFFWNGFPELVNYVKVVFWLSQTIVCFENLNDKFMTVAFVHDALF